MRTDINELGQTLIYLEKEEWEAYGREAGYMGDNIKQASTETEEAIEPDEKDTVIASLREEIKTINARLASLEPKAVTKESSNKNGGFGNDILIREDSPFNESNYPNLFAEQNQDGLIGAFRPRR